MFFRTPFLLRSLYPKLTWRIPTQEKVIYLTFDDGPVPGPTEFVMDQLKTFQAKATFFCIGNNVLQNDSIFKRIIEEGHAVGNHTFNHVRGWGTNNDLYLKDVADCQHIIGSTRLFRPPYGRIKRSQLKRLSNYKIIMWDVLSYDYAKAISQECCLSGVIKATRQGSIVVFHDSIKAEKNMSFALPRFLDHFTNQGYSFHSLAGV
ncbi:MAG TPA: polysaccharide deacetylase family protein [Cyclobacteriaceae bacterium]